MVVFDMILLIIDRNSHGISYGRCNRPRLIHNNKIGKYEFSEMELQIRVCNRIVKYYGSLKNSINC